MPALPEWLLGSCCEAVPGSRGVHGCWPYAGSAAQVPKGASRADAGTSQYVSPRPSFHQLRPLDWKPSSCISVQAVHDSCVLKGATTCHNAQSITLCLVPSASGIVPRGPLHVRARSRPGLVVNSMAAGSSHGPLKLDSEQVLGNLYASSVAGLFPRCMLSFNRHTGAVYSS